MIFSFSLKAFGQNLIQTLKDSEYLTLSSKSVIDSNVINNWNRFGPFPRISNDGSYYMYSIYSNTMASRLIVASIDNKWKIEFFGADYNTGSFSKNSKRFLLKAKDTLYLLNLDTKNLKKISNVVSCRQSASGENDWVAYLLNNYRQELILLNLATGVQHCFPLIKDYSFSKNGNGLLLKSLQKQGKNSGIALKWVSLPDCKSIDIWMSQKDEINSYEVISGFDISSDGKELVFIVTKDSVVIISDGFNKMNKILSSNKLWYYKFGMKKAILKASDHSEGIEHGLKINNSNPRFSQNGNYIFFQLQKLELNNQNPDFVKVDIWNYKDTLLQCTQLNCKGSSLYQAAIATEHSKVIRLTHDYEFIKTYCEKNDQVIISYNNEGDRFWLNQPDINWLVSLKDGTRLLLPAGFKEFIFSPAGKYLLYYNLVDQNYYSLNVSSGDSINISKSIPSRWLAFTSEFNHGEPENRLQWPVGVGAWLADDSACLVYDNYDIWRLDPSGHKQAINLTNGYGRSQLIKFRLTFGMDNDNIPVTLNNQKFILLTAYDTEKKFNGFYSLSIGKKNNPKLLTMGPWIFFLGARNLLPLNAQNFDYGIGMIPQKAKNANVWIVRRQSTTDAPNYFVTTDFKNFKPLTDIQPQKSFKWLTADLKSWKQLDGTSTQGILYRPEDFDSSKKYPVIINYYQQRTHRLYQFPTPEFTGSNIDVAWFVSRGYLVFTPDIYYTNNNIGESACNTITSAAKYLSQLRFVDSNKIGINGHSIGGYETNYIITHTNLFAAAVECAGVSDEVSSALQLGGPDLEYSRLEAVESRKGNINMWEKPELYVHNSPIMLADKIKTPLLIMHNKFDGGVPWAQGVELFLALRRLGKPVWMLQYDNGEHQVFGKEAIDFTIRVTQFFDHFLKGAPSPKWMSQGIPAKLKGIDRGYDLDTTNN